MSKSAFETSLCAANAFTEIKPLRETGEDETERLKEDQTHSDRDCPQQQQQQHRETSKGQRRETRLDRILPRDQRKDIQKCEKKKENELYFKTQFILEKELCNCLHCNLL